MRDKVHYWLDILRSLEEDIHSAGGGGVCIAPDSLLAIRDGASRQFETHYRGASETAGDILFGSFGQRCSMRLTFLLKGWDQDGQGPSLAALAALAVDTLGLNGQDKSLDKALMIACLLGDIPNHLNYHNNAHYRKVMLQAVRLLALHNHLYAGTTMVLSAVEGYLLLIAAAVHDLDHDGKGNFEQDGYVPGRLEQRAVDHACAWLLAAGLPEELLKYLEIMVLCTEVTPIGAPEAPCTQARNAYVYHFLTPVGKARRPELQPRFAPMLEDRRLTILAVMLHEADIGTSAGISYNMTKHETRLLTTEMRNANAGPEMVLNFIDTICQGEMLTEAAKCLFGSEMVRIQEQASHDLQSGLTSFTAHPGLLEAIAKGKE